jgi:predicted dehydrogenase
MASTIKPVRVAIIGCGAITQMGQAPGAMLAEGVDLRALVDVDLAQANKVAAETGVTDVRASMDGIEDTVEAVIIALPHHLHEPIAVRALDRGLHVLIEKPLATSSAECRTMTAAAARNGKILATAMTRRFCGVNVMAKRFIEDGALGAVKSFQIRDGDIFSWPIRTPFLINRSAGGGVLIGNGSHIFDLTLWWFGAAKTVSCQWDSVLGNETDAFVALEMASGVKGTIELSRIRQLDSGMTIEFEKATLKLPRFGLGAKLLTPDGAVLATLEPALTRKYSTNSTMLSHLMSAQINDFADAIRLGQSPEVDGAEATRAIELVERCYAAATLRTLPWRRPLQMPA